jgi:serine protease Do
MNIALEQLSQAVTGVVEAASASVVTVAHSGSGIVFDDGLVVTNAHNLRGDLTVTFAGGRTATASVAGVDVEGDLAVLSVGTEGAPALPWSEREPALGDVVVGLSRPGAGGLRAGVGFVTGLDVPFRGPGGRVLAGAVEHSAPLAHGSSGGPLVDGNGQLVGLNTHRPGDGLYLALPADPDLRARAEALARGEEPRRLRLGVALAPSRVARRLRRAVGLPDREGLLVHAVETGSAAERAGIRVGDLIVSVAQRGAPARDVASVDDLAKALERSAGPADVAAGTVEVGLVRGAEDLTVSVDFTPPGPTPEASA